MILPELLQELRNLKAMVDLVPGVNENIVDIDDNKLEEFPERLVHEYLEYRSGVG